MAPPPVAVDPAGAAATNVKVSSVFTVIVLSPLRSVGPKPPVVVALAIVMTSPTLKPCATRVQTTFAEALVVAILVASAAVLAA